MRVIYGIWAFICIGVGLWVGYSNKVEGYVAGGIAILVGATILAVVTIRSKEKS